MSSPDIIENEDVISVRFHTQQSIDVNGTFLNDFGLQGCTTPHTEHFARYHNGISIIVSSHANADNYCSAWLVTVKLIKMKTSLTLKRLNLTQIQIQTLHPLLYHLYLTGLGEFLMTRMRQTLLLMVRTWKIIHTSVPYIYCCEGVERSCAMDVHEISAYPSCCLVISIA